jgi:arylsulfatase A-like enzyme
VSELTRRQFVKRTTAVGAACTIGFPSFLRGRGLYEKLQGGFVPNIVWVFSDDHSFQTIGAYGGRLKRLNPTPHIDRLAQEGVVFERAYVANSICAPSRATLLTGKFSHLCNKFTNRGGFDHSQQTFPKLLQKAGYQTAMIGKIHLDGKMQGFDYWEVLPGQGKYEDPIFVTEEGQTRYKGYVTDLITDKSLDWLKNKRAPQKPFMIMIHHKAAHRPWIPKPDHMEKYRDVQIAEPKNLFDDYATRLTAARGQKMAIAKNMTMDRDLKVVGSERGLEGPFAERNKYFAKQKPTGNELVKWKYQLYMKDYLRCVWSLDENIGRVLSYLKESGLEKNTVVMYSSDQGFFMGEHGWFDKRFMYEESFRTPLIVRWPGVATPGTRIEELVQNIDFAETFLDIAGAPIPEDMQGRSLVPLLRGRTPTDWRKSLYYHYYEYPGAHHVRRHEGVSTKRYKLIRFYGEDVPDGEEWEFYDLHNDPYEMKNCYTNPEMAEKIDGLKSELLKLRRQYKVPDNDTVVLEVNPPRKSTKKKTKQ